MPTTSPSSASEPVAVGDERGERSARRTAAIAALARQPRTLLAGVVAFVFSWPVSSLTPVAGLDGAWPVALHMAAHQGLDFGPDIVFTYGPLGFLKEPLAIYPWTARLAFAYTAAIHLALAVTLVAMLRPTFGLVAGAALSLLLGALAVQEPALLLAFLWAVALTTVRLRPARARAFAAALGLLAGVELLAKLNTGVTVLPLAIVAVAGLRTDRRATALAFASVLAIALVTGWFASGQSAASLGPFLSGSLNIISGYSEIMGYEQPGTAWEYWSALALVVIGFIVAIGTPVRPGVARWSLPLLWAILAFSTFKSGFVRHDAGHSNIFFVAMLGGLAAFAVVPREWPAALLIGLVALTALFGALDASPRQFVAPADRLSALYKQASTLADGTATNDAIAAGRDMLRAQIALDPNSFAAVQGRGVHVAPAEASVAWSHRLRWHPVPAFQSYTAYTAELDRRNADEIAASDGPERLLRRAEGSIDGRNVLFDQPATTLATLCNFEHAHATADWQVLERLPDRCGTPRLLAKERTSFGRTVAVPASPAGEAIYVEVDGVQVSGLERLRTMAFRARRRTIVIDGERSYVLVPGTAGNGLLLHVPPRVDSPPPFQLDQDATQLSFLAGDGDQFGGDIRLRFYALPIS